MKRAAESWASLPARYHGSDSDYVAETMDAARRVRDTLAVLGGQRSRITYRIRGYQGGPGHVVGRCTVTYPNPKGTP